MTEPIKCPNCGSTHFAISDNDEIVIWCLRCNSVLVPDTMTLIKVQNDDILVKMLEEKLVEKGPGASFGPMYAKTFGKSGIAIMVAKDTGTTDGHAQTKYPEEAANHVEFTERRHDGPGDRCICPHVMMIVEPPDRPIDDLNTIARKARLRGSIRAILKEVGKNETPDFKVLMDKEELTEYMRQLFRNIDIDTLRELEANIAPLSKKYMG